MTEPDVLARSGLLVVDKPAGLTSHDVVARCRRIMRTRKIGHAGTLDPMATGVLVLGVERATKLLGLLSLTTKTYRATIRLGESTTTDDAEGERTGGADAAGLSDDAIAAAIAELTGDIMQVPSTVSAIKVAGKRAYALAREGVAVELAARPVTVAEFTMLQRRSVAETGESGAAPNTDELVDLDVVVDCSSGTYIRALARDLGVKLGVGGHLTQLRRTRVGPFDAEHATALEHVEQLSMGIDEAITTGFTCRPVDAEQAQALAHGRWLDPLGIDGIYAAIDPDGRAVALLRESGRRASVEFVVRPANLG